MYIEQIYTQCLSEATYYIESNGFAAIIDPLREVQPYLDLAKRRNARIMYVFETHFHADFVSGHVDLSDKTGATIVYGPTTVKTGYRCLIAKDEQEFGLGNVSLKLIHTPGHTMESSCLLLNDDSGTPVALFTGDTLFIGDVGRPDLAQKISAALTPRKLAGHLFDSLRNKIMPLPDSLIVYPGHGAGSACGKNMSKETTDTLGHQKKVNYALNKLLSKEEFITTVLNGLTPPPAYFPQDVMLNIKGYESLDRVLLRSLSPLESTEFYELVQRRHALVIDTRDAQAFAKSFIPGSVNIGLDGKFAVWSGTLIKDVASPVLIVADPGRENEAVMRLARIGFSQVLGFLNGGFASWLAAAKPIESIISIDPFEFSGIVRKGRAELLDVRSAVEYDAGHVTTARNIPLEYVDENGSIVQDKTSYVYCAGGYRSMTFVSMMKARGFDHFVDVRGGFTAIKNSGFFNELLTGPVEEETFCDITKRSARLKF
ncbi:MAG: MBL fold metallo-hydrolase [Bacteroidota bacterium]